MSSCRDKPTTRWEPLRTTWTYPTFEPTGPLEMLMPLKRSSWPWVRSSTSLDSVHLPRFRDLPHAHPGFLNISYPES